jgi:hypothetical protein
MLCINTPDLTNIFLAGASSTPFLEKAKKGDVGAETTSRWIATFVGP